jgi:DNA-binding winged helix-turn-helix (wHTH) protein
LSARGELVTREEIQQKLWPRDTYVAFDDGLNTAIKKLRSVLSDTAGKPRFIEAVPRRGYRFVAPVNIFPEPQPATGRSAKLTLGLLHVFRHPAVVQICPA